MRVGRLQAFLDSLSISENCLCFQMITLSGNLSGVTTEEINEEAGIGTLIKQATDLCLSGLNQRFGSLLQAPDKISIPGPTQVLKDLLVFNHDAWPTAQSELIDFGQEAIMRLSTSFQSVLDGKGCIIADIPSQWTSLKVLVSTQVKVKGICGPPF